MKHVYSPHKRVLSVVFSILLFTPALFAQFTPGEGGTLPVFPQFTLPEGKIGGLFLTYSHRSNGMFAGSGSRPTVDMEFPAPETIGANSYTVQISANNGQSWSNYQHYYEDLTLTGDNFSLSPDASYTFRLRANGGPKDGFTSNEVLAILSGIDTYFGGWSLDESMFITGIMAPNIGRGLQASFTVKKLEDNTEVSGHLTYQWFRVNPLTFDMAPIENATGLTYTTTIADAGYKLALRATGDEVQTGGMAQIISSWPNLVSNNSYTSNADQTGFNLYLHKQLSGLTANELELTDVDYNPVAITNVQSLSNNASFRISATLDPSKTPYRLMSKSDCWQIVSQMEGMHMTMPGVSIDFNTDINNIRADASFNLNGDLLTFKSPSIINRISISDISGRMIYKAYPETSSGKIQMQPLKPGAYIIQYQTGNYTSVEKVIAR